MLENTSRLKSKLERLRLFDSSLNQVRDEGEDDSACIVKMVAQEIIIILPPSLSEKDRLTAKRARQA